MSIIWKPSVTVAAIIERDGKFLLVEEETSDGIRFNQPAGHLDPGESLITAVSREAREETAYDFTPESLIGVYLSRYVSSRTHENVTYLRFAFTGTLGAWHDHAPSVPVSCASCGCRTLNCVLARQTIAALWCCNASTITWLANAVRYRCSLPTLA